MIEQLLIYQTKDADLKKIENELLGSEERKKAVVAKKYLDGVEETLSKLDSRAAKLAEEYVNAEKEQLKLKEQEGELESALANVKEESEANFLIKKVEELIQKIKNVASVCTSLSEEIQSVMKEYVTIKNQTKAAQAQYSENGKKYNELKASVQKEREQIEKELEEIKKTVDPQLMEKYLKKRASKMYPIVYEVQTNICGACNMELPMSEMNKLKNGGVIECDNCGKLLYKK